MNTSKEKYLRILSLLVLFLLFSLNMASGQDAGVSPTALPPFIDTSKNVITNAWVLEPFYNYLYALGNLSGVPKAVVVHIGDSHIQADILSEEVRTRLQHNFGNAGRGLVPFYRLAGTNEPSSYRISAIGGLPNSQKLTDGGNYQIGIGGPTIDLNAKGSGMLFALKDALGLPYGTTSISLIHSNDVGTGLTPSLIRADGTQLLTLSTKSILTPFGQEWTITKHRWLEPINNWIITASSSLLPTGKEGSLEMYGAICTNGNRGVIYNAVGANGATFDDYNRATLLLPQLGALKPCLVIISLGTNEAQNVPFDSVAFIASVDKLVTGIRAFAPTAAILLTTPPDSYFKRTRFNKSLPSLSSSMREYANSRGVALWDLYDATGGYGSAAQWRKLGLSAADGVHFTAAGYRLQGELLYKALVGGYSDYLAHP